MAERRIANASETSREGAELTINGALTQQLNLLVSYSYIDAVFGEGPLQDNQLPGVAESQGYLRLSWQPTEQWLVQVSGQYRDETRLMMQMTPSHRLTPLGFCGEPRVAMGEQRIGRMGSGRQYYRQRLRQCRGCESGKRALV